jgi:hypothetical protein
VSTRPPVARSTGEGRSTITLGAERRLVLVVTGLQARHADLTADSPVTGEHFGFWRMLTEPRTPALRRELSGRYASRAAARWQPITWTTEGSPDAEGKVNEWTYRATAQGVDYEIRRVDTKAGFKQALETAGAMVLYLGHARLGRGPCFGPNGAPPGDDWEDGTGGPPTTTGIFRMGYPFLSTPAEEVHEHGYRPTLVASLGDLEPATDVHPSLAPLLARARVRPASQLVPPIAGYGDRPVVTFRAGEHLEARGRRVDHVVHRAGFQQTRAAPYDLGATRMACRCFVHFGCSSFLHNQRILRRRMGWVREGNDRYAFFTTATSTIPTPYFWLYHMLTYPAPSAGLSWEPWLAYVRDRTNADLRSSGHAYRMI